MTFTRIALVVLLLLALTGAMLSYALLMRGHNPGQSVGWAARACGGADDYACDRVLQSRYAGMGGQPTALRGLTYFAFLGTWFLAVGRPNHAARYWHLVPVGVSVIGALLSVYFTYVMTSVLHTICPLCMGTHVVNWLMLGVTVALWPRKPAEARPPNDPAPVPKPHWRYAVVALALSVAAGLLMSYRYQRQYWAYQYRQARNAYTQLRADPEWIQARFARGPVLRINIRPDDPVRGPADAAHTIVVFSDFQCPRCRQLAILLRREVEADETLSARIVFKHFPLSRTCNKQARAETHAYACDAARAAEAARRLGGNEAFWRMHDQLFLRQDDLDRGRHRDWARAANVDPDALIEKMRDPDVQNWIAGDTLEAGFLGVTSTPAVYLDGRYVEYWDSLAFWKTALAKTPATREHQPD